MPEGGSEHYKRGKPEPIELIEGQDLGFHLGNIVKYAVRARYYSYNDTHYDMKEIEEAMQKIKWYADRYLEIMKCG